MIGRGYDPRPSAFSVAYQSLCERYQKRKQPLTFGEVRDILESSSAALVFRGDRTLEEVLERLEKWRMIAILTPAGSKERVVIPLERAD